ncbi:MAG: insulinase family protein [Candidatus Eisenbacteria bacterium]|uniref:Insulinase family protein n=1 Tax=Eiseniibacteriota bacterium TaxID=2212470 RepID=A0A956RQZ0_UNCEI|nr:insulinase family protein [Candidatus Eisenbacteria bacterium]
MFHRKVEESVLDNGLTVLTAANSTSPTATLQVWYRVGSRNERTGITGISHIFEHMMFKGTEKYPRGSFDRIVQENGMTYNAFTSHDFTAYYEVMAADRLELSMELESDRMQGLLLDPEEFASEISVIREERRQTREDPPFGLLSEAVEATMFTAHPYHWPVIGWMTDLFTITVEDLQAYYRDYYRPNNAFLVVAGDVEHARVVDQASRFFGRIERGSELPEVRIREPRQLGERTVSVRKAVQLPGIIVAYRTPGRGSEDIYALNALEYLLFHGKSSRLYQRLVYREQLAVGLTGGYYLRTDPSSFSIRASARPGIAVERLRDAIYAELADLQERPVAEAELRKAIRAIEVEHLFGQESNEEMAQSLGASATRGTWREYLDWVESHRRLTPADLQRAARDVFTETGRTVGYLVPDENAPAPDSFRGEEGNADES